MLVASTDAPRQMSPAQIARKAIVSSVSDFAAKGVRPSFALISLGFPRAWANRNYLDGLSSGFSVAQKEYGLRILGGDTNSTTRDPVIDCTVFGLADRIVQRSGAKAGDFVAVSGSFGHQAAGLLILLGKAKSKNASFKRKAIDSVLKPKARLQFGLKASRFLTSSIDSSDGLAISLYHLAESSNVKVVLHRIPFTEELIDFAKENRIKASDLAFFGGEEFELVCTFNPKYEKILSRLGMITIGKILPTRKPPSVIFEGSKVRRKGWLHFKS